MTEKEKAELGLLYDANYDQELLSLRDKCRDLCHKYNQLQPSDTEALQATFKEIVGSVGSDSVVIQPFHCDSGENLHIGHHFFSNYNFIVLDTAKITIGNYVFIAPNCCISAAGHPLDVPQRNAGLEYAYPVTICDNVWIGANVTILPNVIIGEGAVIAAGSVVNRDIPPNCIAAGNPCKFVREITKEDAMKYNKSI